MPNQYTTTSPVRLSRIPRRHFAYPVDPEQPRWTDAVGGTAWFVSVDEGAPPLRFIGRVWHNTRRERTKGCWTWTRQTDFKTVVYTGYADSKAKAVAALLDAHRRDARR
jgi:hypothetical protein